MTSTRTIRLAVMLPALLCAFVVMNLALPATAQTAPPTKVATVNPAKVFQQLQETNDLKAAMENKRKTLEAQEFEKRQKIKDLQALRDQLKPDAPQYNDRNRDLLNATIEFQVWGQMMQAEVQREQKTQMKHLFDKITAAVQEVATTKGIDLVIAEQRPEIENIDQLNVEQLRALINSRNVLFAAPQIDLSNDVIAAMDAKYKAGK
jgi:Skp family chaperone for outer membrane proteins